MIDTKHWQEILEKEKGELEAELAQIGRPNPNKPGDWEATPIPGREDTPTRDDVADDMEEMDERENVEEGLEERLNQVKLALAKIKNGKYGICEVSGEEIEADRLAANPAARTCKKHLE